MLDVFVSELRFFLLFAWLSSIFFWNANMSQSSQIFNFCEIFLPHFRVPWTIEPPKNILNFSQFSFYWPIQFYQSKNLSMTRVYSSFPNEIQNTFFSTLQFSWVFSSLKSQGYTKNISKFSAMNPYEKIKKSWERRERKCSL